MPETQRPLFSLQCEFCGITFHIIPGHTRKRRFCSRACWAHFARKRIIQQCGTCGAHIENSASRAKFRRGLYCSRDCFALARTRSLRDKLLAGTGPRTETGCLIWNGYKDDSGYGRIATKGNGSRVQAHRLAYELEHGPNSIPQGRFVCHSCDNPACIEPAHLWLGSIQDNNEDKVRKGRQTRGENVNTAVLTEDQVREIRSRAPTMGRGRGVQLAREYGVLTTTISAILSRRNWKHI